MAGRFSISGVLKMEDFASRVMARVEGNASRMLRSVTASTAAATRGLGSVSRHTDKVVGSMFSMGKAAALAGGAAVAGGFAVAIQRGAEFEQGIANLAAVSGAAGGELAALKARAIELGSTTKFTGVEVTGAMESMAKAGFATKDVLSGVSGLLSAAAADGGDLGEISSGLMSTLKGMGAGAGELQKFADQMARAGDSTAASIGSLSESMSKFGPTAAALGVSSASAIAQLSLLEDAGLDASSAGTQLKAVYSKLAAPIGATKKELARLGIQVADISGNMKAPERLFSELLTATSKVQGNVGKAAIMTNLFGLESSNAATLLARAAESGRLGTLTKDLETAAGYADEIASKRLNSLIGDWRLMNGAVDGLINSVYSLQGGAMRGLVQSATGWLRANRELIVTKLDKFIGDVSTAVREALPYVKEFGGGLVQGARDVLPVFRAIGGAVTTVGSYLGGLFGDDKASSARNFGRAIAWIGTAIVGVSAAARIATGVQVGYRAALIGVKGAAWLLKGAFSAGRQGIALFSQSFAKSSDSLAKGVTGISNATTKMGKFQDAAGAATLALGAWSLAWEANDSLKEHTQGLGIGDIAKGMWEQGTWDPFAVVDKHQNALAKVAAEQRAAAKKAEDVGGLTALNSTIAHAQKQVADLSAAAATSGVKTPQFAAAFTNVRSQLEHAALSIPKMSLDPKLADGATAAAEQLDKLTASLAQIEAVLPSGMRASETGPIATPSGSGGRAGSPTTAPALAPQLVMPREQSEEMARIIEAGIERGMRRAMKETPINVTVNGSTGTGSAGGTPPKNPRAGVNVTDSGAMW